MSKITPFLWFDDNAEEAAKFYTSIFRNSRIVSVSRYGEAGSKASGRPKGSAPTGPSLNWQPFPADMAARPNCDHGETLAMKHSGAPASYDRGEILRLAEKHRAHGRIRKAVREYEKILSVDPRDIDVLIKIAPLYIRAGRKDQAKASLQLLIAWYVKRGFAEKAIATLRLALTVDRRDLATHLNLADLYLGRPTRAMRGSFSTRPARRSAARSI